MTSRIETICRFHSTRSFGTPENRIARSIEANQAYRNLASAEVVELVQIALAGNDDVRQLLGCLACQRPGSLQRFQHHFIEQRIFHPAVIFHMADEGCVHELANLISSSDTTGRNDLLLCLAWAGNSVVRKLFSAWRAAPPAWVADLYVPPHAYTEEAGWELQTDGERRDLFFETSLPLVKPGEALRLAGCAAVSTPSHGTCPWCGRQLVALLDLDITSDILSFMRLPIARLRVTTCDVCSCYGTVFSRNNGVEDSVWHSSNARPKYLPDDSSQWPPLPERPLVLSGTARHFMESASWTIEPSVAFSQIGGLPTWVQDAEYPNCPDCDQKMLFIGQISNEDYDQWSEGIYYCFVCANCNVTATTYQQS